MANKVVKNWYEARLAERDPVMDRICCSCGKRYGEHYGRAPYCHRAGNSKADVFSVFSDSGGLKNFAGYLYDRPKKQILVYRSSSCNPNTAFKFRKNK